MNAQQLLAQVLQIVEPLFLLLLAWAVATVSAQIRQRVKAGRVRELLDTAAHVVGIGVADAFQRVVADSKASGAGWTAKTAADVKATVLADARGSLAGVLAELAGAGVRDTDALLARMLEASVLALNMRLGSAAPPAGAGLAPGVAAAASPVAADPSGGGGTARPVVSVGAT